MRQSLSMGRQTIYLKGWRKHRHLTQEQLADRMGIDRTVISKVERGQVGYTQGFLEAAAYALQCEPGDLLIRDPSQPEAIWSIWEKIPANDRAKARAILETFIHPEKYSA